jgi:hypothetical protein
MQGHLTWDWVSLIDSTESRLNGFGIFKEYRVLICILPNRLLAYLEEVLYFISVLNFKPLI